MIHSAFELLSRSPEAYLIVFALAVGDGVVPVVPSETALITAGLLCVVGHLTLPWVIAAGAAGAFVGDTLSYCLGRYAGRPVQERFFSGRRATKALEWAEAQLEERGGVMIVIGRYIPGGRTGVTFSCGLTSYRYAKFAAFDAAAAIAWATYASMLGYLGGRFFQHHAWIALLVALGVAMLIGFAAEGVRRIRS